MAKRRLAENAADKQSGRSTPQVMTETERRDSQPAPHSTPPVRLATRPSVGSSPEAHAEAINRATVGHPARAAQTLLQLQRQHGNRHVQRVVQAARQAGEVPVIQAKLTIGSAGDKYEQEADRIAKQVVQRINGPISQPPIQSEAIQRRDLEDEDELMRKSALDIGGIDATPELEAAVQRARGSGQRLPDAIRGQMGQVFGADFSRVRVHTDAQSDNLNRSIQARAFTTGQDIFLRQGEYKPNSRAGQELLAHELTHVVQQNGSQVRHKVMPAAITGGHVIQRAGTKPWSFSTTGKYMVKVTSKREEFVYQNKEKLKLAGITAEYYPGNVVPSLGFGEENGKMKRINHQTLGEIELAREIAVPDNNQSIIVIKNLSYEEKNAASAGEKFAMDIKIGAYTKSETQFEHEGANSILKRLKQLEHDFKDWQKGNRETGFSILDGKDKFDAAKTHPNFINALDNIIADIQVIVSRADKLDITFVGSSILCVFNLKNPDESKARLIDPDHPILIKSPSSLNLNTPVPAEVLTPGAIVEKMKIKTKEDLKLIKRISSQERKRLYKFLVVRDTEDYIHKYINNFRQGLRALLNYMKNEKKAITPVEVSDGETTV